MSRRFLSITPARKRGPAIDAQDAPSGRLYKAGYACATRCRFGVRFTRAGITETQRPNKTRRDAPVGRLRWGVSGGMVGRYDAAISSSSTSRAL